jgi:hypothetical protein
MPSHNENTIQPSFGEEDLEQAALLFGALKSLRAASTTSINDTSINQQGGEDRLSILFDDHVRSVMTSLSTSLSSIKSTTTKISSSSSSSSSLLLSSLRSATILQHKATLFDLCDSQLVELSASNAPPLGVVAQRLRDLKKGFINSLVTVVTEQHVTSQEIIEKEKKMTQRAENEVSELLQAAQLLERELVSCQEALKKSKSECDEKENERIKLKKQLLETEQTLRERERELGLSLANSAAVTANAALSALYSSSSIGNEQSQSQTAVVAAPKPTLLEQPTIQQSAISSDVSFLRQRLGLSVAPQQQVQPTTSSLSSSSSSPFKSMQQSSPIASAPPLQSSSYRSSPQFSLSPSASAALATNTSPLSSSPSFHNSIGGRILPLKVLLTEAEAIYASKTKSDAANPNLRETLESHMYTFLKARHGAFASMIASNAATLIRSCNIYAPLDNDAAVFSKILRSEIDEDFRLVQKQVKETATELLRLQLKATYPLKLEPAINDLFKERTHGSTGVVDEDSWKAIVRYMYEAKDALVLEKRVVEMLVRGAIAHQLGYPESVESMQRKALLSAKMVATGDGDTTNTSNSIINGGDVEMSQEILTAERSVERSFSSLSQDERISLLRKVNPKLKVLWNDFLRTLLDFQLEGHDAFLSKFRKLFREYDPDRRGVVSTSAFLQMAANVTLASSASNTNEGGNVVVVGGGGPETAAKLAMLADPGNVGQVTFSKAVAVLCKEAGIANLGPSSTGTVSIATKQPTSAVLSSTTARIVPPASQPPPSLSSTSSQSRSHTNSSSIVLKQKNENTHRSARDHLFA